MADFYPSFMKGKSEADAGTGATLEDLKQLKGKRTSFNENGDYRIDNLSYPIDLLSTNTNQKYTKTGGSEYGNNYVVFYINVNESSKLLADSNQWYGNKTVANYSPRDANTLAGQNVTAGETAIVASAEGALAGGIVAKNYKAAALGAGIGAAGTGVIMSQTGAAKTDGLLSELNSPAFSKQMKRLTTAIALHTPNALSTRYSTNWGDEDTSGFQAAVMAMRAAETLGKAAMDHNNSNVSASTDQIKSIAAAIALNNNPNKDAVSAITGLAPNPKREQLFKGVDFRTFNFEYQFFPKSKQEMLNVQNIIYLFKLHMHPEYKDTNGFLYLYPSEFDIVHYNGIEENFNLPRHTSCVLTELLVNYTPNSQFASFEGGAPTQINITLQFKELSQLTKERIQEGF